MRKEIIDSKISFYNEEDEEIMYMDFSADEFIWFFLKNEPISITKYDIVICSPMNRAKQTAEIINKDKNVQTIIDERIRERKLGELEGHEITEKIEKQMMKN